MKKSSKILGLPVISIADGKEIGKVTELVVNTAKKSLEFLVIEYSKGSQLQGKYAIPFKELEGLGDYAVMIEDQSAIVNLDKIDVAGSLLENRANIIGENIITKKGRFIGEAMEYHVDEESGLIPSLVAKSDTSSEGIEFDVDYVLTIGEKLVIVKDELEEKLGKKQFNEASLSSPEASLENIIPGEQKTDIRSEAIWTESLNETAEHPVSEDEKQKNLSEENEKKEIFSDLLLDEKEELLSREDVEIEEIQIEEDIEIEGQEESELLQRDEIEMEVKQKAADQPFEIIKEQEIIQDKIKQEEIIDEGIKHVPSQITDSEEPQKIFDEPKIPNSVEISPKDQAFFDKKEAELVGKRLASQILDDDGNVLFYRNSEITKEAFDKAKAMGKEKVMELALNIRSK